MLAPLRLVPGFIVTATSRRLEIVRERADATGDRNMAGRVRERMRVMAEEAALLDSDRFEIHFSCLRGDHLFLPASVPTERNAACSKCAPPPFARVSLFEDKASLLPRSQKGGFLVPLASLPSAGRPRARTA